MYTALTQLSKPLCKSLQTQANGILSANQVVEYTQRTIEYVRYTGLGINNRYHSCVKGNAVNKWRRGQDSPEGFGTP